MTPRVQPLSWLVASPPDRRLLPSGRFAGATPWLIGIMMFVMMIVAATGLALAGGARLVGEGVAHRYSVQIADGKDKRARALAAVRAAPGVTSATAVPEAELRATLQRWLGPVAAGKAATTLARADRCRACPGRGPRAGRRRRRACIPSAQFIADQSRLAPCVGTLTALVIVAALLVALIALATAAAVVLATRSALETHRGTIDVMHGMAHRFAGHALFQRKIAIDALIGGIAGALVAALVPCSSRAADGHARDWTDGSLLRWGTWSCLLLAVVRRGPRDTGCANDGACGIAGAI